MHRRRPPGARALANWRQQLVHALVVAAGWIGFVWFWAIVGGRAHDSRELRLLVIGTLMAVPVLTLAWVLHNVGIYRRKGPRREVPSVEASYRVDFNGRRIVADWRMLERVRHVEIGVAGNLKFYRFARAPDPPAGPAGPAVQPVAGAPVALLQPESTE